MNSIYVAVFFYTTDYYEICIFAIQILYMKNIIFIFVSIVEKASIIQYSIIITIAIINNSTESKTYFFKTATHLILLGCHLLPEEHQQKKTRRHCAHYISFKFKQMKNQISNDKTRMQHSF